ncbi:Aste57867_5693 [Aphanomyces stellatus]|uniref:Aste57867_5693 protein n=1 Tax=Aphanomyces stellatus TaxID=120398 RepID=A0A485KEK1_9STRA|nr:hypothetical protein As57867_005680 [Aphanomyces stellatus]VFT82733.1 Aste57867_5693 [Aphanomyces stellatus]
MMQLPVWLTVHEPTMSNGKCTANHVTLPPTRRWCRNGAANQLRCLNDIVAAHGCWPSRPEFMAMMSHGNPAAPVELGPDGRMRWATVYRSGTVYNHLTRVYQSVDRLHQDAPPTPPVAPTARHPFYGLAKGAPVPFELWPRSMVAALAYHAPASVANHPMASNTRTTTVALRSYVRRVRRTCRVPPPVHGDVWMRLLFRMLPVNCRFAYLQVERPDAILCAYGCGQPGLGVSSKRLEPFRRVLWLVNHLGPRPFFGQRAWRSPQGRPQDSVGSAHGLNAAPHMERAQQGPI